MSCIRNIFAYLYPYFLLRYEYCSNSVHRMNNSVDISYREVLNRTISFSQNTENTSWYVQVFEYVIYLCGFGVMPFVTCLSVISSLQQNHYNALAGYSQVAAVCVSDVRVVCSQSQVNSFVFVGPIVPCVMG